MSAEAAFFATFTFTERQVRLPFTVLHTLLVTVFASEVIGKPISSDVASAPANRDRLIFIVR